MIGVKICPPFALYPLASDPYQVLDRCRTLELGEYRAYTTVRIWVRDIDYGSVATLAQCDFGIHCSLR